MIPLVAPISFDEPVRASRARSKAQMVLDANRAQVEKVYGSRVARARLVAALRNADASLSKRLEGAVANDNAPRSWTYQDVEATLAQVRHTLSQLDPQMRRMLDEQGRTARAQGARETTQVLELFEGVAPGSIRPLSIGPALRLAQGTVLAQHATSVGRYGAQVIASVQRELVAGVLVNRTFDEMTRQFQRSEPLLSRRYLAERVVRTECMAAYNDGHLDEMQAQKQENFHDLKKKLIETFDKRTAKDSYTAHGEVRELDGLFVDGMGRHYLRPPGRPNDRAVVIPWRDAWEEDSSTRRSAPSAAAKAPRAEDQATAAKVATQAAPAAPTAPRQGLATLPTLDIAGMQARKLSVSGGSLVQDAAAWARVFAGRVPTLDAIEAVYSSVEHGVQAKIDEIRVTSSGRAVVGFGMFKGKRRVGEGVRFFSREPDGALVVDHSWLTFDRSMQGKGIGRVIARQSMAAYAQMGADRVELTAAMVGRYTWARLGYEWSDKHAVVKREELSTFLTRKLGEKRAAEVLATTGTSAAEVAALSVKGHKNLGKQFLLDKSTSTWPGSRPVVSPPKT